MGRSDEGVEVIARGGLPGERVRVQVQHQGTDGRRFGRVREVEQPSPDRIPSPCRHFLLCGGCDFLHLDPEAERAFKRRRVAEALGRPLETVDPVVPSPRELHYRAVAKLVFGPRGRLGSYAPRSHYVVDMRDCRVHAPVVERVADTVRRAVDGGASTEGARYLVLRAALPRDAVHVTLVTWGPDTPAERELLAVLATHAEVAEVWRHVNRTSGDAITDPEGETVCLHRGTAAVGRVGTAEQHLATGAFSQVNPGAAERLYARVAELVEPEGRRVLDLYSGSGGVALTLAGRANEVLGIERSRPAVEAARRALAPWQKARFEVAEAEEISRLLKSERSGPVVEGSGGGFSAWVVNPPRKGLAPQVVKAALELLPERIVYVSCHPDRLARDLEALSERYTVDAVTPVDMFPKTRHVETVVRLRLLRNPV